MTYLKKYPKYVSALITLIVTVILLYPNPTLSWVSLVKGLILFIIMWGMLSYIFNVHIGSDKKKISGSYKKMGNKKDPLEDQPEALFKEFLNQIFNQILSLNSDYIISVYMSDPANDGFVVQNSTVHNSVEFLSKKNAIIKSIGKKSEGIIVQQNVNPEAWNELFGKKQWRGSECLIGTSIDFNGTLLGYLIVNIDHFSKINEKDIQLISQLGKFISYGMNIIDRLEYHQRNIYFNRKINELFNLLDITSEKIAIFKAVTNAFSEFIKYDLLTISVGQISKKHAVLEWQDGKFAGENNQAQFLTNSSVYGIPYVTDETVNTKNWHDDYPTILRCKENDPNDDKVKSMLIIPIPISDRYKGAIGVERAVDRPFTPSDLWVMSKIAGIVGIMLKWHFDFETIKINAIHDDLTGLLNYRAFMKRCEEEISRATRFNQKLVLVVIDIDAFKQVNDNFGHEFGNMVLKDISSIFKNSVRNIDVVGRYGGEEFIIILVDTDKEKSQLITQRIVDNIANYPIFKDGQQVKVSISAGIAEFPSDSDKIKSILEKADKAMYSAKRAGGNRVNIYVEDN